MTPFATSVSLSAFFFWTIRDEQNMKAMLPVKTSSLQEQHTLVDHSIQPIHHNALSELKPWGEQIPTQLCYTVRLQQNAQVCMHPNASAAIAC
jgi:hypothetical protein